MPDQKGIGAFRRLVQQQKAVLQATECICKNMKQQGVTRSELAKRLGRTRSWVTQLLKDDSNMTLETLADLFTALDIEMRITAVPMENQDA